MMLHVQMSSSIIIVCWHKNLTYNSTLSRFLWRSGLNLAEISIIRTLKGMVSTPVSICRASPVLQSEIFQH